MKENAMTQTSVLVIDDEPIVCKSLKRALENCGFRVEAFEDPEDALARFDACPFDVVVTDVILGETDGIQILTHVTTHSPTTRVIIMSAFACIDLARKAMDGGAFDFVAKPFETSEICAIVRKAVADSAGTPESRMSKA